MGTKVGEILKYTKDIIGMGTGAAGIIIQAVTKSWDPVAMIICAVLLGVPLTNLKALIPPNTGTDKELTPEPSSPSPPLHPERQQSGQ